MSVQFNNEQNNATFRTAKPKGITGFIIKTGFAKDVKQANLVMFGIIGIMAVIFFISTSSLSGSKEDNSYDPALDELGDPILEP